MARRLVDHDDSVEWFTAGFPGGAAEEQVDGVRIVRSGRQWSVHWHAYRHYRGRLRDRFDAVIDEVNTMPFFTPLWAPIPSFMLIFQLAREVWWYESRFPLNAIGYAVEPIYLRVYRRTPVFTISASTEADLRRLGLTGPIEIVPVGTEAMTRPVVTKAEIATFLYVGRLAPSKRITDIVRAFAMFRQSVGQARLWLVGDGPKAYTRHLRVLGGRLGVASDIRFWGKLAPDAKHNLMAEAHALLMTSVREGWGLVVTEANACGTPAVVYDVPGLRDSVQNGKTGLVVPPSPSQLALGMERLWRSPELYRQLSTAAERWSATFSFDLAAERIRAGIALRVGG